MGARAGASPRGPAFWEHCQPHGRLELLVSEPKAWVPTAKSPVSFMPMPSVPQPPRGEEGAELDSWQDRRVDLRAGVSGRFGKCPPKTWFPRCSTRWWSSCVSHTQAQHRASGADAQGTEKLCGAVSEATATLAPDPRAAGPPPSPVRIHYF